MSSYRFISRAGAGLVACLAVSLAGGCGAGQVLTQLSVVPEEELAQLPSDCEPLAAVSDDDLSWARAEGDDTAIVLDTPEGSCVAERESVLTLLLSQHRGQLVAHIVRDFAGADPSPHPDLPSGMTAGADPSPHPDKPRGTATADPSPHPDKNDSDDADDLYALLVAVGLIPSGGSSGSAGAPPPPPPPVPMPAKSE